MSIKVMSIVWDHFNRGGSEKLAMLALADWCNDQGGSLHPSIAGVAKKINVSESQARRIIHGFIDQGYLTVIANHSGGDPGKTRQYQLNIRMFTPSTDATPCTDATPSTHARYPLHPCALPLAPMTPEPSLTINKPPIGKNNITLDCFLQTCRESGASAMPLDDPIFAYAGKVGIPEDYLHLGWIQFKFLQKPGKKQKDWRATFRNYVKLNYLKVWFIDNEGKYCLTTLGKQLQREVA